VQIIPVPSVSCDDDIAPSVSPAPLVSPLDPSGSPVSVGLDVAAADVDIVPDVVTDPKLDCDVSSPVAHPITHSDSTHARRPPFIAPI
jgi:hypothetical protein